MSLDSGKNELKLVDRTEYASGEHANADSSSRSLALPEKPMFQNILNAGNNNQMPNPALGALPNMAVNTQPPPAPSSPT